MRPFPAIFTQPPAVFAPILGHRIANDAHPSILPPSRTNGGGGGSNNTSSRKAATDDRNEDNRSRTNTTSSSSPLRPVSQQQERPSSSLSSATTGDDITSIEAIALHLRENHECAHADWSFVRGRHRCEECGDALPLFIFECRQCMLHACNRCRRNRL
ncbi:IBR finger domain protein [Lasiodiplodia theobromae]|nr:IBR finger domain protein [Lasiodiplodia theobromae]